MELFNNIENTEKRIIITVQLILNITQLSSNNYELTPLMSNMDELSRETINTYKIFTNENNLSLNFMNSSRSYDVRIDQYSVYQVLSNLIDNAIKYTESGKVEFIISDLDDDNLMLAVKNTGIGIAEAI